MKRLMLILVSLWFNPAVFASDTPLYLDKFNHFVSWYQQLPTTPDPEFLAFVDNDSPLARKLREKWLYQLAWNKDWATFSQHYQTSTDTGLQCYEQYARYQQGNQQTAIAAAETIWLTGGSLPKPCDGLFNLLLANHAIRDELITQRIVLALEDRNMHLASYLLKQFNPPRQDDAKLLASIYQNPKQIALLTPGKLHGEFYLYGLKLLAAKNLNQVLQFWLLPKTGQLLDIKQKQAFLAFIAQYKAMRSQPDTNTWFAKVMPAYYNDKLLEWQIRYGLKYKQWHQVEKLIYHLQDKDNPCWQYWLARAKEAQGQQAPAHEIYNKLAKTRHYYGFLASHRIKATFSFENENPVTNRDNLIPYQPVTEQIKSLYLAKQTVAASRLLTDFLSELPKEDKSALIYWIANELQWHGKSVYLTSNNELNNQLAIRFPLAYHPLIQANADYYQIPKALIYAIIRQESGFRDDVVSPAGAHGLMQLMPSTASLISKQAHIAYTNDKQLFLSQKNITIGTAYLQQLAQRFRQHPILMSAAYNAGPKQVVYWMKTHPAAEMDIWIETLPWPETRNYLKNIIAFYVIYQYRMHQKPDISSLLKTF